MKRQVCVLALAAACQGLAAGGELFVANYSGNRQNVEVFRTGDSGNAYPQRVVSGPRSLMDWPWAVAVDARHLYVGNYTLASSNQVVIYDLAENSTSAVPVRTLTCPMATLCRGLAADSAGIVVGSAASGIFTFAPDASGDSLPLYRIQNLEIGLDNLGGLTADDAYLYAGINSTTGAIHVFRRTDDGAAAPLRTVRCSSCCLRYVGAVAVDAACLYVLNDPGTTTNASILVFDKSAAGDAAPLRRIHGPRTGLSSAMGIAVDDAYIYVTSRDRNCVQAFPRLADGDVAPHHVISPEYPNPHLFACHGLAVRNEAPPLRSLAGPTITADGVRVHVTLTHPAPVSIAISAFAGQFAGIPVDWFAVAAPDTGPDWFFLQTDGTWAGFPASRLADCRPALQHPMATIDPPRTVLRGTVLPPGGYTFYAIVDHPMDGVLNLLPGQHLYDRVRVEVLDP